MHQISKGKPYNIRKRDGSQTYPGAKREVNAGNPIAAADEPVRRRDLPEDVEQEADGVVGRVVGENGAGVGDGDAPAAASMEVEVVGAGAGSDDEAEGREGAKDGGVDGVELDGDGDGDVGGVGCEEVE